MERKPPSSVGDFVAVLRRRKYWILIPAVIVIAAGLALTRLVPRTYKSTSTLLAQGQKISSVYVKSNDNGEASNRLEKISLKILSGTSFPAIIEKQNLYPELRGKASMTQLVSAMRRDVLVEEVPDATDNKGGVDAFMISYIGRTPQQTREVTKEITEAFLRDSVAEGRQQTQGADSFLTAQVKAAGDQLAAEQSKIEAFKVAHVNSLPEQAQANLQLIGQYQTALQANEDAIAQANQQRVYLQSVLNVKQNGDQGVSAPPAATPLQIELAQKQEELRGDLLKYTPEHPDIIRLKHDIEVLKVQIADAPKSTSPAAVAMSQVSQVSGPTMNDQLRGQLIALNTDMKSRQARQAQIEAKIAMLQGSVGGSPAVQTEFAALNSDYAEMQKNYNTLLEKQQEAAMASALNQDDQSQPFVVVEPANLPSRPFRPDPMLLDMGAVLGGLFIGLVCGLVVEVGDDTMHTSEEVADYLKLPVMVALPKCAEHPNATWNASTATN